MGDNIKSMCEDFDKEKFEEYINELVRQGVIANTGAVYDEFCDDSIETEHDSEFKKWYPFILKSLASARERYGIKSTYFFFKRHPNANGVAKKHADYYLIEIHSGTIFKLKKIFDFELPKDVLLDSFIQKVDVPVCELMYQFAFEFTFYHELGHLVQFSSDGNDGVIKQFTRGAYDYKKHLLEIDADTFSAVSLATHLIQYADKHRITSREDLMYLVKVSCSSILFYLVNFQASKDEIYYKESTHPHPVVRIFKIIGSIVGHLLQKFNIDFKEAMNETFTFYDAICQGINPSHNALLDQLTSKEILAISQYLNELGEGINRGDISSAMIKWNARVIKKDTGKSFKKKYVKSALSNKRTK